MSMASGQDAIQPVIRLAQIIVGTLMTGVAFFLVIATLVDLGPDPGVAAGAAGGGGAGAHGAVQPAPMVPFITYAALAAGAVLLPMSFVVPGLVAKKQRQAIAAGKVAAGANPAPGLTSANTSQAIKMPAGDEGAAFLSQLIIGAAMAEGAAFFAGAAYLVEKNPIALGAALVLLAALAARFPTAGRAGRWIEQQREKLREEQLEALSSS
jgi:hypothetical protein